MHVIVLVLVFLVTTNIRRDLSNSCFFVSLVADLNEVETTDTGLAPRSPPDGVRQGASVMLDGSGLSGSTRWFIEVLSAKNQELDAWWKG